MPYNNYMNVPVKAAVFKSLRENRNYDISTLSQRSGLEETSLVGYDTQDSTIELATLEKIAKVYKKRWTIFLLQAPEVLKKHGNDNRSRHNKKEVLDVDLLNALDTAEYILETSAELGGNASKEIPQVNIDIAINPDGYAQRLREAMKVDDKKLHSQTDDFGALRFWKDVLTDYGLYISEMGWETESVRAFSIIKKDRTIVVLSTKENPQPRTFSLFHELCHVLMKQEGICDRHEGADDIEALCNRFAAGFLMPETSFRTLATEIGIKKNVMPSDDQLKSLRKFFGTSRLATYRRLYTLGYITKPQYESVQNDYSDSSKLPDKKSGKKSQGGDYYRNMLSSNGKRFTVEAFNAYSNGAIGTRTLSRILNVSVDNLQKFRERVDKSGISSA